MFWLKSKKLENEDLVNAVKILQDSKSSRREKNTAFEDLRETFGGLIGKKMKSVSELASNTKERNEIRHHIETSFLEILMDLTPKSAGEIVGYIAKAFNTKVNKHSIRNLLGKGEIVSDINKYKIRFKNALRAFYEKNKRMPEFNNVDDEGNENKADLEEFAKIIRMPVDKVLEVLKLFGSDTIKSMSEEIGGDDKGGDAITLMDTLKSNEPLPDEVLRNKQIMQVFMNEIKKLPEREQKVLMMYYHPDDPNADMLTSNQLAEKLQKEVDPSFTERMVRHWIAIGREKLRESPKLKELYTASMIKVLVKVAMSKYKTTEDMVFEIVAQHS
jgi:DNA-directed RNA polymerase specialized sigma subunit